MLKMKKLEAHIPDVEAHIQKELAIALKECKDVDVCDKLIADLKLSKEVNAMPQQTYTEQEKKYPIMRDLVVEYFGKDFLMTNVFTNDDIVKLDFITK